MITDAPLRRGASVRQRMMEAIRRHFLEFGASPSHRELAIAVGVRPTDVGRILRQLAVAKVIELRVGVPRGILLPDRTEMLSRAEIEIAVRRVGGTVTWPLPAAEPFATACHVDPVTDCGLPIVDPLSDIVVAEESAADDASTDRGRSRPVGDSPHHRTPHAAADEVAV